MVNDLDLCLVTVHDTIYPMLLFPAIAVGRLAWTFFREVKVEGRAGSIISSSNQGCPISDMCNISITWRWTTRRDNEVDWYLNSCRINVTAILKNLSYFQLFKSIGCALVVYTSNLKNNPLITTPEKSASKSQNSIWCQAPPPFILLAYKSLSLELDLKLKQLLSI